MNNNIDICPFSDFDIISLYINLCELIVDCIIGVYLSKLKHYIFYTFHILLFKAKKRFLLSGPYPHFYKHGLYEFGLIDLQRLLEANQGPCELVVFLSMYELCMKYIIMIASID